MSTISDNTATNLLLDRIIIRRVWDKMESLGLKHTKRALEELPAKFECCDG